MINAEYDIATVPVKRKTPIEISADEFYNSFLHQLVTTEARPRCYLHPEIKWLQEPMRMFKGISLTELTQLEQPRNTSDYSPIHARLTQKAVEDEIDFQKDPWRIKPMIITKARQNEFTERMTRRDYITQRMCGTHYMNPMPYWILYCQKVTYETYINLSSQVDFYVNDLYLALNAEARRRIPIQCSEDEWEDKQIIVGLARDEVQIRDSDDDLYNLHSEDDDPEDEHPVPEDVIDIDASAPRVDFPRFYWCHPRADEVE
jgi:hypothetical protein